MTIVIIFRNYKIKETLHKQYVVWVKYNVYDKRIGRLLTERGCVVKVVNVNREKVQKSVGGIDAKNKGWWTWWIFIKFQEFLKDQAE